MSTSSSRSAMRGVFLLLSITWTIKILRLKTEFIMDRRQCWEGYWKAEPWGFINAGKYVVIQPKVKELLLEKALFKFKCTLIILKLLGLIIHTKLAEKEDIRVLLDVRNNKDLFTTYLNQQEKKEVYLLVAEMDRSTILGFGLLLTKLGYKRITEPYSRTALFHNEDGTTNEKTYTRVDLKRSLNWRGTLVQ